MKLNIEIDLSTDSREQISLIANFLNNATNASRRPTAPASTQPEVVELAQAGNTGSSAPDAPFLAGGAAVTGAPDVAGEIPEVADTGSAHKSDAPAPVKKRGRPAKAEVAAQEETPDPKPQPEASGDAPAANTGATAAVTLDDVRAALQKYTAAKGMPAGIELLKSFDAARVSELKEDQYAAVVEACRG